MVPLERLEELTRLVGETASAHLRIGRMLKDRFKIDPATCTEFNELSRLLNDLQDRAMRTQMVPVSTITDQLQRAVRDLSRAQGKDIRWEVARYRHRTGSGRVAPAVRLADRIWSATQ